ncbi:DMT family transporter [Emcibacter sp.]|uniref:DMT family transporter n=1 Tax=Emcibacter sp. TaxID=1979954 RepID=UPI002AA84392|nr:DMT family transporter [Emcibacter sp.]
MSQSNITANRHGQALIYMAGYALCYALLWALVRLLSEDLHPFQLVFFRTFLGLVFVLPALRRIDTSQLWKIPRPLYFFRAFVNISSVFGAFYAVSHIPLADAVAYSYMAPIFATIMAAIFLQEKLRLPRILAILCAFAGMLILLRPGFRDLDPGVIAALASALFFAATMTSVKKLTASDHPTIVTIYGFALGAPISLVVALFFWQWPTALQWPLILALGLLSLFAHICMARAFSMAEMTAVLPVDFTRLIFASVIGISFFGDPFDLYTWIGAAIILGSAVYVAYRENRRRKIPQAPTP